MYRPLLGMVKARKLEVKLKKMLFFKTVLDYENRSSDMCSVVQAIGQAGRSLSM